MTERKGGLGRVAGASHYERSDRLPPLVVRASCNDHFIKVWTCGERCTGQGD